MMVKSLIKVHGSAVSMHLKYVIVSRIEGRSEHYDMALILDVATDIYGMRVGERYHLVLSASLTTSTSSHVGTEGSLADRFEYVMHGKVYKAEEAQKSSPSNGLLTFLFIIVF